MSYEEGRRPLRCCERDVWDPNWQPLYGHSPACPSAPGTPADRLRAWAEALPLFVVRLRGNTRQ